MYLFRVYFSVVDVRWPLTLELVHIVSEAAKSGIVLRTQTQTENSNSKCIFI